MKRNISELLNDLDVEDIPLSTHTPLSACRIKDKAIKQIGERKHKNLRWIGRVAAVAAAVMLMTLTAFAAENVIEVDFLESVFKKPLTNKQQQVVETLNKDFTDHNSTEPVTSNGATLTPISAICDTRICYLHVRLEAPQGVVLPDLPEGQVYSFNGEGYNEKMQIKYFQYTETVNNVTAEALPDADPTDNIKEFTLKINADWYMGFNGEKASLKIYGLWIKKENKNVYKNLFRCNMKTDFTVGYRGDRIDITDIGKTVYNEQYDFSVTLERLYITHLRVVIHYTATEPNDFQEIIPDGAVCRLVMKDGTSVLVGNQSKESDGEMVGYFRVSKAEELTGMDLTSLARECYLDDTVTMQFDAPIVLDDIDYIEWCGGNIIDVN